MDLAPVVERKIDHRQRRGREFLDQALARLDVAGGHQQGGEIGEGTRLTRTSMLEVMKDDYVRTARAKGLRESIVVPRHMMRNALIPVITIIGPAAADLVTGSIIIETIFNAPGIGKEFVTAIGKRDYSVIMGLTVFYAVLIALANVLVDLSYGFIDPRIRRR